MDEKIVSRKKLHNGIDYAKKSFGKRPYNGQNTPSDTGIKSSINKRTSITGTNPNSSSNSNSNTLSQSDSENNDTSNELEGSQQNNSQYDNSVDNENYDNKDTKVKGEVKGLWKKMPLKVKLIIIGVALAVIFIILFLVVMITPLMSLGIIDIEGIGNNSYSTGLGYTSTISNTKYWWPVGGSEVIGGIAKDNPTCTYISSYFGYRTLDNKSDYHSGLDIACNPSNTYNVIAALDGTVETVVNGYSDVRNKPAGYGNYVRLSHADGTQTIYGHMYINSITVKVGDKVRQGQVLGKMGSSGNSTGTHLHFELRTNGSAVNPLNYISANNPRPKSSKFGYDIIIGEDNKQTVCLNLKADGYSNEAIAGIMGNMENESAGYLTDNENELGCNGIVQWCFNRIDNLKTTYGNDWSLINSQIEYVMYELDNDNYFKDLKNYLSEPHTTDEMAYKFCMVFENPGKKYCTSGARQTSANNLLNYVKNNCR